MCPSGRGRSTGVVHTRVLPLNLISHLLSNVAEDMVIVIFLNKGSGVYQSFGNKQTEVSRSDLEHGMV